MNATRLDPGPAASRGAAPRTDRGPLPRRLPLPADGCAALIGGLGLAAVVALHLALGAAAPFADPPRGYGRDHAVSIDGSWYLAEARASATGGEAAVSDSYRQPLVTLPARGILALGGVNLASSRGLSLLSGALAVALLGWLLRHRYGWGAGLSGALLLAVHPVWIAYVRSTLVYPYLALWSLAVIALASGRRSWCLPGAMVLLAAGAWGVKPILLVALPALVVEAVLRGRRRSRSTWPVVAGGGVIALLACVAASGPWLFPRYWGRLRGYFTDGGGGLFEHLLEFDARSGFISAQPVIALLAAAGGLLFLTHGWPGRGQGRSLERLVHLTLWPALLPFVLAGYSPLRYLLPLTPLLVFAAVGALHALGRRPELRGLGAPRRRIAGILGSTAALAGAVVWARGAPASPLPGAALGVACAAGALGLAWLLGPRLPRDRRAIPLALGVALALLLALPRTTAAVAGEDHTLLRADRQIAAVLPGSARLVGPYAHVLTLESGLPARQVTGWRWGHGVLRKQVEESRATHLLTHHANAQDFRALFAREGVPITFVASFLVRGFTVNLFRLATSAVPLSVFEEAREALDGGDLEEAEARLRTLLRTQPHCAVAWSLLGEVLLRAQRFSEAHDAYARAIAEDPARLEAHLTLAELFRSNGYGAEAAAHLRAADALAPEDRELREQIRAHLAALQR